MNDQPATPPTRRLSPELIGIVGTGIALAVLILTLWTGLRTELSDLRHDMREDWAALRTDMREDLSALRTDLHGLEGRLQAVETRLYAVEIKTGIPAVDELVPPPSRSDDTSPGQLG